MRFSILVRTHGMCAHLYIEREYIYTRYLCAMIDTRVNEMLEKYLPVIDGLICRVPSPLMCILQADCSPETILTKAHLSYHRWLSGRYLLRLFPVPRVLCLLPTGCTDIIVFYLELVHSWEPHLLASKDYFDDNDAEHRCAVLDQVTERQVDRADAHQWHELLRLLSVNDIRRKSTYGLTSFHTCSIPLSLHPVEIEAGSCSSSRSSSVRKI
jgi:hypothetical protein